MSKHHVNGFFAAEIFLCKKIIFYLHVDVLSSFIQYYNLCKPEMRLFITREYSQKYFDSYCLGVADNANYSKLNGWQNTTFVYF